MERDFCGLCTFHHLEYKNLYNFFVRYFSWVKSNSSPHCILTWFDTFAPGGAASRGGGSYAIHLPSSGKVPLGVGVQCMMSNGHMGSPREQNDRQFVSSKRKIFWETFYKVCLPFTFKCPVLTAVQVEDPAVELYLQAHQTGFVKYHLPK